MFILFTNYTHSVLYIKNKRVTFVQITHHFHEHFRLLLSVNVGSRLRRKKHVNIKYA